MIEMLSLIGVVLTGVYFIALAVVALFIPDQANRFLLSFAATPIVHYIELLVRLAVGASLVVYAPNMFAADAVSIFGWILLITTAILLVLPWRWHHFFAQRAVPRATRYIGAIGVCSLALGLSLLAAIIYGSAT